MTVMTMMTMFFYFIIDLYTTVVYRYRYICIDRFRKHTVITVIAAIRTDLKANPHFPVTMLVC